MNPADILLWPDGFWCFRSEHHEEMLRDENYRILPEDGPEWLAASAEPETRRKS